QTINFAREGSFPLPPGEGNWLGTDDQGRDVLARLLYGFRLSVLFGLLLACASSAAGMAAGALQGYLGGRTDLFGQRFMEIWNGVPVLYLLIIVSASVRMSFWLLFGVMLLFGWMRLVPAVRRECLRVRSMQYVTAARALGVGRMRILARHVLPNALTAALSMLPFVVGGSITGLTALDFLGFGLPPEYPSLGEMIAQGKNNLFAPWIGLSVFVLLTAMLSMQVLIGEGVRDALDPSAAPLPAGRAEEMDGRSAGPEAGERREGAA
ncbi:MAG: ABC transporter permease subunit, partial [Desulfovibrionaceae bacterium]|nr:ABC transporter permease subunit [Desulfovibrionaceae bacterium]